MPNLVGIWHVGWWRFMDMSPKFEAAVRALLVPTAHIRAPYSHQLWEASYDELSREYRGKLRVITARPCGVLPLIVNQAPHAGSSFQDKSFDRLM